MQQNTTYDKKALVKDWLTGNFTDKQLAEKYGLELCFVKRILNRIFKKECL